jgi:hypothetical protein
MAQRFEDGLSIYVDHVGTDSSEMWVGGQANTQLAAGVSHEDTTDEGSLSQYSIPANSLVAGSTIRFWAAGKVEDNNGSDTLVIAVRLGSSTTVTSNTAIFSTATIDVADGDIYCLHGIIQVRTAGHNGTGVAMMSYQDSDATGTAPKWNYKDPFTIDCTAKLYLDITADWNAAHADNEVNSEMFVVDIYNPNT